MKSWIRKGKIVLYDQACTETAVVAQLHLSATPPAGTHDSPAR